MRSISRALCLSCGSTEVMVSTIFILSEIILSGDYFLLFSCTVLNFSLSRCKLPPVSWLREVWSSYAEIPYLLRIELVAIVALARVDGSILTPSGVNFLISVSKSLQALSTTALKLLLSWSLRSKLMWRSLSCLSFLAADTNPGAQSVTMMMGPDWSRQWYESSFEIWSLLWRN